MVLSIPFSKRINLIIVIFILVFSPFYDSIIVDRCEMNMSFEMRGFFLTPDKAYIDWLESIGINFIEFYSPPYEDQRLVIPTSIIQYAHEKGMKVHVIIFTNWIVTKDGPNPYQGGTLLCPQDEANFIRTVNVNRYYIEQYGDADAFEVFTGDPGGCACGRCNVSTYLRYVKEYHRIIGETGSEAEVYANLWSLAEWSTHGTLGANSTWTWKSFFDYEIVCAEEVIEALPSLPEDVHVILPCHHLYRPLCIQEYSEENLPNWPNKTVVDRIHVTGRKVLAWPHFLFDDHSRPSYPNDYGLVHSTVGYIKRFLKILRDMDFDGVVGHTYTPTVQLLNTYAFAALAQNTDLTVLEILKDFSKLIAQEKDAEKLFNTLILLESQDVWFGLGRMPEYMRIQHPTPTLSWEEALNLIETIELNHSPPLPMLNTPRGFLSYLKSTILSRIPTSQTRSSFPTFLVIGILAIVSFVIVAAVIKIKRIFWKKLGCVCLGLYFVFPLSM